MALLILRLRLLVNGCLLGWVDSVVFKIPFLERSRVDLNNAIFHKGLCSDQFVVRGVVHDIDDLCFAANALRTPGEVSDVQSKSSEFIISASNSHSSDSNILLVLG